MHDSFIKFVENEHPIMRCLVLDGVKAQQSILDEQLKRGGTLFTWTKEEGFMMKKANESKVHVKTSDIKNINIS